MPAKKATSVKKKATKKKSKAQKNVPPEFAFYLCDGRVLHNLIELKRALKNMDDGVFYYHVNQEKNDFATWIHDIIKDFTLVCKLRKATTKKELLEIITKKVKC